MLLLNMHDILDFGSGNLFMYGDKTGKRCVIVCTRTQFHPNSENHVAYWDVSALLNSDLLQRQYLLLVIIT